MRVFVSSYPAVELQVMNKKNLTGIAFAAGCAITLAVPATQAQLVDRRILMYAKRVHAGDHADEMAARNKATGAQDALSGDSSGAMKSTGAMPDSPSTYGAGSGQ